MAERKSYWEKLKDPRWQKRRLEMLNAADWTCQRCGEKTKQLHVHHKIYRKGAAPWAYEDRDLLVLCDDCHEEETVARAALDEAIACLDEFDRLRGFIHGHALIADIHRPETHSQVVSIPSTEYAEGVGARIGLNWYESNYFIAKAGLTIGDLARLYELIKQRANKCVVSDEWHGMT